LDYDRDKPFHQGLEMHLEIKAVSLEIKAVNLRFIIILFFTSLTIAAPILTILFQRSWFLRFHTLYYRAAGCFRNECSIAGKSLPAALSVERSLALINSAHEAGKSAKCCSLSLHQFGSCEQYHCTI